MIRSIQARFRRVERAAAASRCCRSTSREWTQRFVDAHPSHRQVLEEIEDRYAAKGRTFPSGWIGSGQSDAFDHFHALAMDLPHLFPAHDQPPWSPPADAADAEALLTRLINVTVEYQLAAHDPDPRPLGPFRAAAQAERRRRFQSELDPCHRVTVTKTPTATEVWP